MEYLLARISLQVHIKYKPSLNTRAGASHGACCSSRLAFPAELLKIHLLFHFMLTPRTMKNILPLLLVAVIYSSCSNSKKHSQVESTQTYTPGQNKTEESRLPASDTAGMPLQAGQPLDNWDKK